MMRGMFAEILPNGALSIETSKHMKWVPLFAEEQLAIRRAGPKRRAEFISARACAREALSRIGFPDTPVPKRADGAPVWPDGVVGSVTHCAGLRAVAVASRDLVSGLGIDAEVNAPLPAGVLATISSQSERAQLACFAVPGRPLAQDRLLFSAKEAAFKCLRGAGADVADIASVRVVLGWGVFVATADRGPQSHHVTGRWLARGTFIYAAATTGQAPESKHPGNLIRQGESQ